MNSCELVSAITALAIIIANETPNDDELSVLASSFNQLGDTLATIAAQRELQKNRNESSEKSTPTE
ncbi:DUF6774 domain-containing protein [Aminipila terrae]|uniref:DUF6774 domain-containing protein n=1 Tax=Aminipila terrae TaxID=2697030 RepID=A0A6P1MAR1_9FIRM|nr:DUF6774 domain-containing protein [Aminipila terrae]QHI71769.1 hypothetical protein Ami3637_04645 [Aminipila terrae]